tara:strand:- start:577 stop:2979 length:2403 start_codon:yes stop_codon:yes gene_type:complete
MALFNSIRMGASGAEGAYEIERSLRFNSADDTYLEFTPSSTGNRKVWTFSCWLKRTKLGTNTDYLFSCNSVSGNNGIAALYWYNYDNTDDLSTYFDTPSSGDPYGRVIDDSRILRDTTAWYHLVWQVDAANTTQKLWVNGEEQTLQSSKNPPNVDYGISFSGNLMRIGRSSFGSQVFNGYIAEVHYCDGQKYQASDFGETDSDTGQWIPKEVDGLTYGTNGCYLNFSDNSDTTATTLGKDYSGNGNNWTPNNFSVAAGTGNDSLTDTPTNNYCTWNLLDYVNGGFGTSWGAGARTANGALEMTASGKNTLWHGTFFKNSGKWYYESTGWNHDQIKGGWGRSATSAGTEFLNANCFTLNQNGQYQSNSPTGTAGGTTYGGSISSSDVIGCAIDLDNLTVAWSKNGQWGDGSGNWDETYDNASKISITAGYWTPTHIHGGSSAGQCFANFGQRPLTNDPPSGFKTLCASNISTPTIKNPTDYFNTVTYTGNNASNDITTVGFQPNLTWIKQRNQAENHFITDSVRGAGVQLRAAQQDQENDDSATFDAFLSTGFSLTGTGPAKPQVNDDTDSYVAWNWKESATAGFDIVAYNGDEDDTISHNLGVSPEFMIIKSRESSNDWMIWHHSVIDADNKVLNCNNGDGVSTSGSNTFIKSSSGGSYNVSSSTFKLGSSALVQDGSSNDYIAYLFDSVEGYSKVDTYIGNGDSDGTFVYTGFRPAWILLKHSNSSEHWYIYDNKRNTGNPLNLELNTSTTQDDGTFIGPDFLANGFKIRNSNSAFSTSGQIYLYLAFAENSFKYANAR